MVTRECKICHLESPETSEYFHKHATGRNGLMGACKRCVSKQGANYRMQHHKEVLAKKKAYRSQQSVKEHISDWGKLYRTKPEVRQRNKEYVKRYKTTPKGWFRSIFGNTKARCKKENIPFDITAEYLLGLWESQGQKCAIFGDALTFIVGDGMVPTNPSIDRIDPSKGYIQGNIQITCLLANWMKSCMGMEEFVQHCCLVVDNYYSKLNRNV